MEGLKLQTCSSPFDNVTGDNATECNEFLKVTSRYRLKIVNTKELQHYTWWLKMRFI